MSANTCLVKSGALKTLFLRQAGRPELLERRVFGVASPDPLRVVSEEIVKGAGDDAEVFDRVLVLDHEAQDAAKLRLVGWSDHVLDRCEVVVCVAYAVGVDFVRP